MPPAAPSCPPPRLCASPGGCFALRVSALRAQKRGDAPFPAPRFQHPAAPSPAQCCRGLSPVWGQPGAARHRGSAHHRGIPTRSCAGWEEARSPSSRYPGPRHPKSPPQSPGSCPAPQVGPGASGGVGLAPYGARPGPAARSAVMQPVMKGPTHKGVFQVSVLFYFFYFFFNNCQPCW